MWVEQHKRLSALSKGYRQRVGLAKALLPDPKVLILDEPTTGLDPNQIAEIREVIKKISTQKTVLLSTHIMQEVEALCEKVVIINKGSIVADDTLARLKSMAAGTDSVEVVFENDVDTNLFQQIKGVTAVHKFENKLVIESSNTELKQAILAVISRENLPLLSIRNMGGNLEEIFYQLTHQKEDIK
jgi:ABC-2 type transport system ATP-binding protein